MHQGLAVEKTARSDAQRPAQTGRLRPPFHKRRPRSTREPSTPSKSRIKAVSKSHQSWISREKSNFDANRVRIRTLPSTTPARCLQHPAAIIHQHAAIQLKGRFGNGRGANRRKGNSTQEILSAPVVMKRHGATSNRAALRPHPARHSTSLFKSRFATQRLSPTSRRAMRPDSESLGETNRERGRNR